MSVHFVCVGGGEDGPTSGCGIGDSSEDGMESPFSRLAELDDRISHIVDNVASGNAADSSRKRRCMKAARDEIEALCKAMER